FKHSDPMFHGVVLANYTIITGTVGQRIDASNSLRGRLDVIALVVLANSWPPQESLSEQGPSCEINEDDQSNPGFKVIIPLYNTALVLNVRVLMFGYISTFGARPCYIHSGKFVFGSASSSPAIISDLSKRVKFVPAPNYHGTVDALFRSGALYDTQQPGNTLLLPEKVGKIVYTLLIEKITNPNVTKMYIEIMKSLENANTAPTKANILSTAGTLENQATGDDRTALTAAKELLVTAYTLGEKVEGKQLAPSPHKPVYIDTPKGHRVFVYSDYQLTLDCRVVSVNDAPDVTSYNTYLPPIGYNLSLTPNNGFLVGDITTRKPYPYGETLPPLSNIQPLIKDIDGDITGLGVVYAQQSSIGSYYYKLDVSSPWQQIDLNNTLVNGKLVGEGQVLLLKPTAQLKFEPTNSTTLWSNIEASAKARILFAAWDQSDNKTSGVHEFQFPVSRNASISERLVSAFVSRKGCDGKPGSRGRVDSCGRCGGDGTWCRGCDGVVDSGAIIDYCGNCTGGTTGKAFNFRKDCGGGCGTSFNDTCGACQKYGKVKELRDCAGVCYGKAKTNCGHCVLGNTGKSATFGQDLCGICGGTNSACLDCSGTPKGTKKNDICHNCLEKSDARFNAECVKLGDLDPIGGDIHVSNTIKVAGAGLQSYTTASCQFVSSTGVSVDLSTAQITDKTFSLVVPINSVEITGRYSLRCKFDSLDTYYATQNNITFYNRNTIVISSVTPNETEADTGPVNITIAGSGFPDTGHVRCITNVGFKFPAIYVDSTTVICLVGNQKKSKNLKLFPQFGSNDNYINPQVPDFQFYARSPHLVFIAFTQNLQALIATMNKPSKHVGESCNGIFSALSVAKFGTQTKCILRTPHHLFITLSGNPTIAPKDTITYNDGSLTRLLEDVTKRASGTRALTVQGPPNPVNPTARLSGPNYIGTCGEVVLDGSASSGAGGRRLSFQWDVEWASNQGAVSDSAATTDINDIKGILSSLPGFSPRVELTKGNLVLNLKYEVQLSVSNFLGKTSVKSTLVVVRENKQLPVIDAGQAHRIVKASRDVIIQAKPILSPCLDPNAVASKVEISWEIDAVGINLGVKNKPILIIKPGSLQGGKTPTSRRIVSGGVGSVIDSDDTPCFIPDPSNADKQIRLVMKNEAIIILDVASTLQSNAEYTFIMTYNKGSRHATSKVVIKVERGTPPKVVIAQQPQPKENPTKDIIIEVFVESTMSSTSVRWDCVEEDGYGYVDLYQAGVALTPLSYTLNKEAGADKVTRNLALVLAAHSLSNGVSYKFRVTVAHADSTAIGETIITTNAAPSQGSLVISPTSGTAMETLFILVAEVGWSDDPDDYPLKYQCGYISKNQEEIILNFFGESSRIEDVKFPPGNAASSDSLTVFVDCMDALGAVTRQTTVITVLPKVITIEFLDNSKDDIQRSLDSGDWNAAIGNMGALLLTISPDSDPSKSKAVTALKEAFADNTLNLLQTGGLTDDPEAKSVMYESMRSITEGGTTMNAETKRKIFDTIFAIEIGSNSGSKRRRRRAAESVSSSDVYSVSQAKTTLSLLSNLIDPNLYDSDTMKQKSSFLPMVDSTGKKVCAGLALGMSGAVVKDKLVVLRSEKNSFSDVATAYTEMACNDCPSSLAKTAKVQLGTTLQNTYASWKCSDGDNLCSGACLITSQQIYDLLSTSSLANTTLTSVVDIKLYNPVTYAAISVSTLATPVSYHLPVLNVMVNNDTYFECHRPDQGCCPVNLTFCNETTKCHRPDQGCCPAHLTFCNETMKCHRPDQGCCPVNLTFCNETMKCHRPDQGCCPVNLTFCNGTMKCHRPGEVCCPVNLTFCNETMKCHRPDQGCCPVNLTFCNGTMKCHRPGEVCCPVNLTFCNETMKCHRPDQGCCPVNLTFCNSTMQCHRPGEVCCPVNLTFCKGTLKCHRPDQVCCPVGQVLCNGTLKCIQPNEVCCPAKEPNCDAVNLYKTAWDYEELQECSSRLFVSGDTIAVTSVSSDNGTLEYYDGSKWVSESNVSPSSALVVGKTNMIRFNHSDPMFHGVVLANYTIITGTVGQRIDASNSPRGRLDVIALVVLANSWPPQESLSEQGPSCEINEDDESNPGFKIKDKIKLSHRLFLRENNIPRDVQTLMRPTTVQVYSDWLKFSIESESAVAITPGVDVDDKKGKVFPCSLLLIEKITNPNVTKMYIEIMKSLENANTAPTKANILSTAGTLENQATGEKVEGKQLVPSPHKPLNIDTPKGRVFVYSDNQLTLYCRVVSVNDAPDVTSYNTYLPPIGYNLSLTPNNGFLVGDITTRKPYPYGETLPPLSNIQPLIKDIDGDITGLGVVYAQQSSIGSYYYKLDVSSPWQKIDLNNTLVNGKLVGEGQVLLLKPIDQLKFEPTNSTTLWSNIEASAKVRILFAAWDQSDNKTSGVHEFQFPVSRNASISKQLVSAFVSRKGCDGKPGSRGRVDSCGRCGGDGTWCRGCDGVVKSGAIIDYCGNCTGGTTGKAFNFRKDCGGGCGTSFNDTCGACQKYGNLKNLRDCAGVCYGKAKTNCGHCVLGNTGKSATFGQDLCGICGGTNSTCLDCSGTPKGTKKKDICRNCLEKSDARFNAECVKLGDLDPISGDIHVSNTIKVAGAGLQSYTTTSCQFVSSIGVSIDFSTAEITDKTFSLVVPINSVEITGRYSLRCKFDSLDTYYATQNNFTFYNRSTIVISSVTPNETEADTGPVNITIAGSGFPDTGHVRCITNVGFKFPAIYVDSTTVICLVGNQKKSKNLKLFPQFGSNDNYINPQVPDFQFYARSPHLVSIAFTQNLQALIATLNKPSKHVGESCNGIFSSLSVAKFGTQTKCILRTPQRLFITLSGNPTIAPDDNITCNDGSLTRLLEDVTKRASGTRTLTVQGPPNPVIPTARLSGPNYIGKCFRTVMIFGTPFFITFIGTCGEVVLDGSASSGAGGRRLGFQWEVEWASNQGAVSDSAKTDLTTIKEVLSALQDFSPRVEFTKVNLVLSLKYEFRLSVSNFLGKTSVKSTLVVVRENKQLPVIDAGQAHRIVKASRDVIIQAKPILSPCLDPNAVASKVEISWEIDAVGINLGVKNKPILIIKPGSLQGGKTYTLTVRAAMASDQNLFSTKDIVLEVQSSPLIASINGGSYQVVGAAGTLKLDGSASKDPDQSTDSQWWGWECIDSDDTPCFIPDPSNADKQIRLVMKNEAIIILDVASTLQSNAEYTFIMKYNKGSRHATKKVVIKVERGTPPKVVIAQQPQPKENPTKDIIIEVFVESTMSSTSVRWDCVEEDGYGYVDLYQAGVALTPLSYTLNKEAGADKVTRNLALVLAAHSLSNGVSYKFRVTVAHADSTAIGETIITTNAAPSQGSLVISPTNGTAMETLFSLVAEVGWSDDPDDYPLKYQCGYISKNQEEIILNFFGESSRIEDVKFPPGNAASSDSLTVFVDCMDALGAVTRQTTVITVLPKVITIEFLDNSKDDIQRSLDSGDWNAAIGNMGALLLTISPDSDPSKSKAVTALKEAFADNTLNLLQTGGLTDDPEAKSVMYESMRSITDKGTTMNAETKRKIFDTIFAIEIGSNSGSKRRRRRAAESVSSSDVYSVSQAKTTLSLLSNLIDPNLYDSDTMKQKSSFLPMVDSTGKKVCAGLALGMSGAIVTNKLVVLRSEKNSFSGVATAYTEMACNDCPSSLAKSAKVQLGTTLQNTYASWKCSDGDNLCSGACLITSQQIYDLLSTSSLANTTLTSVVDIKLYNPVTYAAISVSTLATPVSYHLPVLNVTVNNYTYFECKRWNSGSSSWSSTGCVTNHNFIVQNGTKYIECKCTQIGYTAAFKAERPPTTQPPPTTAVPPTTVTEAPAVQVRRVRFALQGDYDTLVTPATVEQFTMDVTQSIAAAMSVNESRITNVIFTKGSIIVQFVLLPSPSDSESSLTTTLSLLESAVKSSNFTVSLSNGTVLMADPSSFSSTVGNNVPTAIPTATVPTKTENILSDTEIIIISCVCGGIVLIVLIVIIVYCWKKRANKGFKVSPTTSEAQPEQDMEMEEGGQGKCQLRGVSA
ncbi:hypothetical protein QZH41_018953, partial [Actinostola sp. cb2023]